MRKINSIAVWSLCLLASLFSGCNDYVYTAVTITMVNQSSEPIYLWMEYSEERDASTLVPGNSSRTFHQAFTFTDDHLQTHLTVVATKDNVFCGEATMLVNADTTKFTAVYNTGAGITITERE